MARFFIDRPVFAWVIAILIMLGGALSLSTLPIAQYPDIAPPQVSISAMYPGASAKTLEETVTQVIEQKMSGLDNLLYMSSSSDSSGNMTMSFTFENGTDLDTAQVQVQNKLALAQPMLPEEVTRQGISVQKSTSNFLLVVSFVSEDGSMNFTDLSDYVASYIQDPLGRIPGVGETQLFGGQYAMRIWCDPLKMEQYKLNPSDVIAAVQAQNSQVAGGQVGAGPALPGQEINITVIASSRLETAKEFESIILRTNADGSHLLLGEVARIELNAETFLAESSYNGLPAGGLGVKLASGANALDTAKRVKAELETLSELFPQGMAVHYSYDTSPFVEKSIASVFRTLFEAIALVFMVMYLFLQSFRATIIPTIAVPVVLLGTFGVLAAVGFSINSLTMFAMVLAIGLLVDDAIVVVENVERLMHEEKLSPLEATRKSMDQITGALVGVVLVISAVFVPMAFMGGSTGVIYRQFSVTIVAAMFISLLIALVLTPTMCASLLTNKGHGAQSGVLGRFNVWFEKLTLRYQAAVRHMVMRPRRWLAAFGAGLVVIVLLFGQIPSAFLPDEDQGMIMASVQLPPGATFERTEDVMRQFREYFEDNEPNVESVMTVSGFSFAGSGQNAGMAFLRMKDWSERKGKNTSVFSVIERTNSFTQSVPEAQIFVMAPPAIIELGTASGFDLQLLDRAGQGHDALMNARNQLLGAAGQNPNLRAVRPNGLDDVEQYELNINLPKAGAMGLTKGEINTTLAAYWGSVYINDFMDNGRTKKVFIQAEPSYRMQSSDFDRYHIRNSSGEMVPFSSFLSMHSTQGSPRLERYQGFPSVNILGEAAPGRSSGEAMDIMEELGKDLPAGFELSWTGMSFQEKQAGSQAFFLYAISLLVVFLCLAALYESWSVPLSVLLAVPTGVIGAVTGVLALGMSNDIYFQIGLLTIVGLSAKNSILIVEFAKSLHEQGMDLIEATCDAVRMRLRPIIMTSLAFILGVLPLALSSGAGSGGQNALGTTVVAGMLTATGFGIFMTPVFFVLVTRLFSKKAENSIRIGGEQHA